MKKLVPLKSVADVILVLGGVVAAAQWTKTGKANVSLWQTRGIPREWHYRLDRELRKRGYLVDPKLFKEQPTPEERKILQEAAHA